MSERAETARPQNGDPGDGRSLPPILGLPAVSGSRRRWTALAGFLLGAWIIVTFVRQVGDASAASARADLMRAENAALAAEVAGLEAEYAQLQAAPYIAQVARGYDLGSATERSFSLAPGAPPLPPDAPGSAAARVGAKPAVRSPLDSWLSLLFGPSPSH